MVVFFKHNHFENYLTYFTSLVILVGFWLFTIGNAGLEPARTPIEVHDLTR
jgi:hypothetical protein